MKDFGHYRYVAIVTDANIEGELFIPVHTIEEAKGIILEAGRWVTYPDATHPRYRPNGSVLLDAPRVILAQIEPHANAASAAAEIQRDYANGFRFPYYAIIETGPKGGVRRTY